MEFPGEKLILKMWETLADKGVGSLLEPWHAKRIGKARTDARRHEMLALAQAQKEADDIRAGAARYVGYETVKPLAHTENRTRSDGRIEPVIDFDLISRTATSIESSQAVKREVNVAKSLLRAEEELAHEDQAPPDEQVDEDWLFSWRDHASRVSSEDLQNLWGKVLAGEIKNPGTYSIRTLDFLKGLSKSEAEAIARVAQFVIEGRIWREKDDILIKNNSSFSELLTLQEIGILSGVDSIGLTTKYSSIAENKYLRYLFATNKMLIVENQDKTKDLVSEIYLATAVGRQVFELANVAVNEEYIFSVAKDIANKGYSVMVADYKRTDSRGGHFFNACKIEPDDKAESRHSD